MSVTGNKSVGEKVVEVIGYDDTEKNLLIIASELREKLIEEKPPEIAFCQILLGGIENGAIVFYAFYINKNQEMVNQIAYTFLSSNKHGIDLDGEIKRIIRKYKYTSPTKTLKVQKELNGIVAKKNPSVNYITFNLTVRK